MRDLRKVAPVPSNFDSTRSLDMRTLGPRIAITELTTTELTTTELTTTKLTTAKFTTAAVGMLLAIGLVLGLASCDGGLWSDNAEVAWSVESPESHGFVKRKLKGLGRQLIARDTKAILVAHRGAIVYEDYAADFSSTKRLYGASLAKALVGGLSLLLALQDGLVTLDEPGQPGDLIVDLDQIAL